MIKLILTANLAILAATGFSQKKAGKAIGTYISATSAKTNTPSAIQGTWMYGHFSMTEYWSTSPGKYLGNAFQFAIAFVFKADGSYEQYFSSSTVKGGLNTYHQSYTSGSITVDSEAGTITTFPKKAHYKRTHLGFVEEDRDLLPSELAGATTYVFKTGKDSSGKQVIYLTLQGTPSALAFVKQ